MYIIKILHKQISFELDRVTQLLTRELNQTVGSKSLDPQPVAEPHTHQWVEF